MNLLQELPRLLPSAIAWAEARAARAAKVGESLTPLEQDMARSVGVAEPERVHVEIVERLPLPEDAALCAAALQAGLLGPNMTGLTLGHSIFICRGHKTPAAPVARAAPCPPVRAGRLYRGVSAGLPETGLGGRIPQRTVRGRRARPRVDLRP